MALDTDIEDWLLEHDRAVRDVVRVSIVNYESFFNENFPSDAMMIGNNWFYIAGINHVNGEDKPIGEGMSIAFSQVFTINPKQGIITARYIPLDKILRDFRVDLGDEYALFPITEGRTDEAKGLGPQGQIRDDWFDVHYDGKTIKVFPLQPHETAFYFGKTSEGSDVGLTVINTDSPLQ